MSRALFIALAVAAAGSPAVAQLYDFTINSTTSGLSGPLTLSADTTGTMIGNYEETKNPTGTRTKPGIFGTFGATENVPVATQLGMDIAGPINSRTAGGFRLDVDPAAGTVSVANFGANFLHTGPVNLPISLSMLFESFRTRNPTSTYIGGVPLTVPFGEASLTQLTAQQVGPGVGTLTQTGPNTYDFVIAPLVAITAEFSALSNSFLIPGAPAPLAFSGELVLEGNTASIVSMNPLLLGFSSEPNLALPQFPLDLPTVLPPGETAHLLLNLTLTEIGFNFDGTSTIHAAGVLVPSPGSAPLLLAGLWAAFRRRR